MNQTEFEVWPFDLGCRHGSLHTTLYAFSHSDAASLYAEGMYSRSRESGDDTMPGTYTLYVAQKGLPNSKEFVVRRTHGFSVSPVS